MHGASRRPLAIFQEMRIGACIRSVSRWDAGFILPLSRASGAAMIDREKVLAVLRKRFPGSTPEQFAAAANAIVGLDDEWEDVTGHESEFGYHFSVQCGEMCYLAEQAGLGAQFRLFRRRAAETAGS